MKLHKLLTLAASALLLAGVGIFANQNKKANADQPYRTYLRMNGRHDPVYGYYDTKYTAHRQRLSMPRYLRHRGKKFKVIDPGEYSKKIRHQRYYVNDNFNKRIGKRSYFELDINSRDFIMPRHGTPYQRMVRHDKINREHTIRWERRHPYAPKGHVYCVGTKSYAPAIYNISLGYQNDDGTGEGYTYYDDDNPTTVRGANTFITSRSDLNDFTLGKIVGSITIRGHKFYKFYCNGLTEWVNAGSISRNMLSRGGHLVNIKRYFKPLMDKLSQTPSNSHLKLRHLLES